MTDTLLPIPRLDGGVEPKLTALAAERMAKPARAAGYELRLVGATVLPQGQTITLTPWGTWLFVDHVDDPTADEYGGKVPIPAVQYERLAALARAGVRPDHLWLAHELPPEWREGDALPSLVPPPPEIRRGDELVQKTIRTLIGLPGKVAETLAAGALAVGLDPIVLGGVQHPAVPVVNWVVLAQWDWE